MTHCSIAYNYTSYERDLRILCIFRPKQRKHKICFRLNLFSLRSKRKREGGREGGGGGGEKNRRGEIREEGRELLSYDHHYYYPHRKNMKVNPIITLLLANYSGLLQTTLRLVTTNETTLSLVTKIMARNAGQKWVEQILRGQLTCQSSKVNSRTLLAKIILHWLFKISRNSLANSNKYVVISSGLFPIIKNSRPEQCLYNFNFSREAAASKFSYQSFIGGQLGPYGLQNVLVSKLYQNRKVTKLKTNMATRKTKKGHGVQFYLMLFLSTFEVISCFGGPTRLKIHGKQDLKTHRV